jgi:hypothetical protein
MRLPLPPSVAAEAVVGAVATGAEDAAIVTADGAGVYLFNVRGAWAWTRRGDAAQTSCRFVGGWVGWGVVAAA